MKTYIAKYGNGTARLFDAASENDAAALAYGYGKRHGCGACLTVKAY